MKAFPLGLAFQQAAIRLMTDDDAYCAVATKHFTPSYFESQALGWCFERIQNYYAHYKRPPSVFILFEELRQLDPLVASQVQPTVEALAQTPAVEAEYIRDRTVDFIKRNLFVERFEHARQLYNKGDVDSAYDFWQRSAEEIQNLDLGEVDRGWFFSEFEDRHRQRQADARAQDHHTFPTGIEQLDRILNGGLSLGELGAWIAAMKVGKSMMLAWTAFYAVRALQVPVLATVHEGGRRFWENRLDACWSRSFVNQVARGDLSPTTHRDLVEEYRMLKNLLVIRGYTREANSWNATVMDLYTELTELRSRYGFRPKMIVVDYADLLRSRDRVDSETAHQRAAWRDLKSLTDRDDGYAIWTASQAQRLEKAKRDPNFFVRSEHVADAVDKVRIADFYGSINATLDERAAERARLFFEDYRHGQAGSITEVKTDFGHGRFIRSILSSYAPVPEPQPVPMEGLE